MVDDTRRKRRLQQDPYFYGAEERPGALLTDIDKLGLYGDVEGVTVPEADRIEGGSFQLRESIPSQYVPRDVLGFNDAGITQVPEDVSGVMSDRANALYHRGLDRVTVPHERYGGFDPATMAHEVGGHRGFNVMGRPMGGFREHDVIYGQDPREWARDRVGKVYNPNTESWEIREEFAGYPLTSARQAEIAQREFTGASQMAGEYSADLERQLAGVRQEQPGMQGINYGGLLAEGPQPEAPERREGLISTAKDALTGVFKPSTKSGSGGDVTPTTLKQAQSMDKAYYLQDGKKKLAVTADQLARFKKSDRYDAESKKSALTQWANIAGKEGLSGLIPKKTIADVKTQKPGNLSGNEKFLANWAKNYYTGEKQNDPKYLAEVESRLTAKVTKGASDAIASAVKIFGTDKRADGTRMTAELMRKTLEDIGKVESGYRTRIAGGGRPERGFWQVLPSTAKDALKNASGYFGPTFNKTFKDYDWVRAGESPYESLSKMSQKEISKLLESDDKLGAAFAAVQVLRTFDK
jgi:hypothetical protein